MSATLHIERAARRDETLMVPRPDPNRPGLVTVDATWGTISPIQIAPGVLTVGELEVIEHVGAGLAVVDTRLAHFYQAGTIPSAGNVPHGQIGGVDWLARPGSESLARRAGCSRSWSAAAVSRAAVAAMILSTAEVALPLELAH